MTPAGKIHPLLRPTVLLEVALIVATWWLADLAVKAWHLPVPAGVLGLLALSALLLSGLLPHQRIARGAQALLGDMLLLFIPPLMALVNHPELLSDLGVRLSVAVVVGTLCVMACVGWVVQQCVRLEARRHEGRAP